MRWERELERLRGSKVAEAGERAMVLRWFRRRHRARDGAGEGALDWVALYEPGARRGDPPAVVFPVQGDVGPGHVDQESLVLVRGAPRPGRGVVLVTGAGIIEPAGRPRRPGRFDPGLVGER
jgi:hypothetical protein